MWLVLALACAHHPAPAPATPGCDATGAPPALAPWIGAWRAEDTSAVFRICMVGGQVVVDGFDSADGERFEITDLQVNGAVVAFTSRMPSTDFSVHNVFQPQGDVYLDMRGADAGVPMARYAP